MEKQKSSKINPYPEQHVPDASTQDNDAWQNRFYEALLTAFPSPLFSRFKKEGLKDIVSWTSDGHRFFFSWSKLDPDELQFEMDSQAMENPSTD